MKTKILIATLLISFISCKNEKKEMVLKDTVFANVKINILNDKKWDVDKPMMAHIQHIKNDVIQFNGNSLDDHKNLSAKIDENLGLLTSNCTMKGQAHDELHKWLLPFLEITETYKNSDSKEKAQNNYQIIKQSFKLLDENFK